MKKVLLIVAALCALPLLAQDPFNLQDFKVLDHSRFIITYDVMMTKDTLKPDEKSHDRLVLMSGDSISSCYSLHLHQYDSAYTEDCKRHGKMAFKGLGHFGATWTPDVFKYAAAKRMTVIQRMRVERFPILQYEENLELIVWNLSSEAKEILGYQCFKAECDFRGRLWTAWFTMQIPVKDGPWKFYGLPGLILQVADDKGHYSFSCVGMETTPAPMLMINRDEITKAGRKETIAFEKLYYDDLHAYIWKLFPGIKIMIMKKNGDEREASPNEPPVTTPYNPIELE